jgi:hypothetical protein
MTHKYVTYTHLDLKVYQLFWGRYVLALLIFKNVGVIKPLSNLHCSCTLICQFSVARTTGSSFS